MKYVCLMQFATIFPILVRDKVLQLARD